MQEGLEEGWWVREGVLEEGLLKCEAEVVVGYNEGRGVTGVALVATEVVLWYAELVCVWC